MKKNGFTLTELLGVVVILGLIALIVFPNVNKSIKNSKKRLYEQQITLIEDNARRWGIDHTNLLPDRGVYYLELNELVTGGYVSQKDIKDPRDERIMNGCIVIKYNRDYNQYQYQYVETMCSETQPESPTIEEKVESSLEIATNDPGANMRYVGSDPSNYVWFNNELWRIIGVFNGQAKIIKNDFYTTGREWDENGLSNWGTATLQVELNQNYFPTLTETSRSYIDTNHAWNMGGVSNYESATRSDFYLAEKSGTVFQGRNPIWNGSIGLAYVSDYAYATATNNSACETSALASWSSTIDCYSNNWLYRGVYNQWTLSLRSDAGDSVFTIGTNGSVGVANPNIATNSVHPVVYLKANVRIVDGTGSSSDPYQLSM